MDGWFQPISRSDRARSRTYRRHRGSDGNHQQGERPDGVGHQPLKTRRVGFLQRKHLKKKREMTDDISRSGDHILSEHTDLDNEHVGEAQADRQDPGGVGYGEVVEPQSAPCCQIRLRSCSRKGFLL